MRKHEMYKRTLSLQGNEPVGRILFIFVRIAHHPWMRLARHEIARRAAWLVVWVPSSLGGQSRRTANARHWLRPARDTCGKDRLLMRFSSGERGSRPSFDFPIMLIATCVSGYAWPSSTFRNSGSSYEPSTDAKRRQTTSRIRNRSRHHSGYHHSAPPSMDSSLEETLALGPCASLMGL